MTDSYIGVPPQSGFISQEANQYFTGLTQNYIDLNQSISSLSSVIVLVNGVVQENSTMSLTSSTRITLGATLVSADKVTCIYVAKISSTQAPATGSVTSDMLSGSIANSKLANSSVSINGSTLALGGSLTGIGEANTPYFEVKLSSQQDISDATKTLITFNSERFDSGNAFNTSTYKYIPQTAGKYIFTLVVYGLSSNAGNSNTRGIIGYIDKNGSSVQINEFDFKENDIRQGQCVTTATIDMNGSSDYVQFYGEVNTVDGVNGRLSSYTMARGWRLTT